MSSTHFRKSTFSNADCVEAMPLPNGSVIIRHSKHPDTYAPIFSNTEWRAFVDGVKAGEFDFDQFGALPGDH